MTAGKGESMKTIDMSAQMQALRDTYRDDPHHRQAFLQEASVLWGGSPNDAGVLPATSKMVVNVGSCSGEIKFAETEKGYWLIGINAQSSYSGVSYSPSVYDHIGYKSYEDAYVAGVNKLCTFFSRVIEDKSSTNSHVSRVNAERALQSLRAKQNPQLKLF